MRRLDVLRNKEDFSKLHKKGKTINCKYAVIVYLENNLGYNRKAYLASKKIGNSVRRHRAARLLRESFRLIAKEHNVPENMDFLLIAKFQINDSNCADVKKSIEAAMMKAGIVH